MSRLLFLLFNAFLVSLVKKIFSSFFIDDLFLSYVKTKKIKNTISLFVINDLLLLSQSHTHVLVFVLQKKISYKKTLMLFIVI
jgi:hypothetical protein